MAGQVARFAEAHGIGYPSALIDAPPEDFFAALGMDFRQIPQTWVVDAGGEVVHRIEGILDEAAAAELAALVRERAGS